MRALSFDRFGDPCVLQVADIADPITDNGDAVIAVKAASVNPSDVKNVATITHVAARARRSRRLGRWESGRAGAPSAPLRESRPVSDR